MLPDAKFCGTCGFQTKSTAESIAPQPANQQQTQNPPPNYANQPAGNEAFHFDSDGRGQGRGYSWEIKYQGAFALAVINLQAGQAISAEAGAMVSMSANVDLHSEMKGGVFGAFKRAVGGESAFVSTFTAQGNAGEVTFAPGAPGDVVGIELKIKPLSCNLVHIWRAIRLCRLIQNSAARNPGLAAKVYFYLKFPVTDCFSFHLSVQFIGKHCGPGEQYVVDTGHLVAWEGQMQYNLRKAAKSGFFAVF